MLEQRNLKIDLFALAILVLTIFLSAAVLSYDPADPPSKLVFPERAETLNVCGRSGAIVSSVLLDFAGLGAYYLLLSLAVLAAALLSRRTVSDPLLRTAGWLISLLGFTTLVQLAVPQLSPGPVIGAGGYLGATMRSALETHFASVGSYILALSLILVGLLLATDYLLVHLFLALTAGLGRVVIHIMAGYAQTLGWKTPSVVPAARAQLAGSTVAVRISGRPAEPVEAVREVAPAVEETAAGASEAEADDASLSEKPAKKGPLASMLRIRRPHHEPDRREMIEEIEEASRKDSDAEYDLPAFDLLLPGEPFSFDDQVKDVQRKAGILEKTFANFGFNVKVVDIQTGPVIAQFEVELEAGLRLSKITSLADDLAIGLRVPSVRIVAPIPGKNTVGIEVPNQERQLVRMREVMEEANGKARKMRIPLYLGKDVAGVPMVADLTSLPHLLIAGRTGTGKSVCLNTIIVSMLMTRRPDEVRMLLIDPKMVELSPYRKIPHLMHPVVTDMRKAEAILAWAVEKMEERYQLLARAGVRHISVYNQLGEEELMERIRPENEEQRRLIPNQMPYIVVVADEMADMMMTAAKEVEGHIIRLAQKSRAVGIHLVLATQKPTVDVITGLIKSNLPARISFQVSSRTDSRVVLDEMGADKLLGNGDMLFLWPGTSTLIRGQGTYLSDDEINSVIASVATTEPDFVTELVQLKTTDETAAAADASKTNHRDDLYEAAVEIVIREGRGSVSLLQRALGIGYGRAARLVDYMAEDGIVGNYNGSQAREVMITLEQWAAMCAGGQPAGPNAAATAAATAEPPRRPGGEILLAAPERRSPRVPLAGLASAGVDDEGPRPSVALRNDDEDLEEEDAYDDEEEDDEDEADDEDEYGDEDDEEEEDEELDDEAVDFAEAPFDDDGHPAGAFRGEEEDDGPGDAPHRAPPRPRRRAGNG